jgi:hypothetical protein
MDNIENIKFSNITPFKDRDINLEKTVDVYRCLNRTGSVYSIRQGGKVVAHTTHIALRDCKFVVSQSGVERVRREGHKNVHAYIRGFICIRGVFSYGATDNKGLPAIITYNPYTDNGFMCRNLTNNGNILKAARGVIINDKGVTAAYTIK